MDFVYREFGYTVNPIDAAAAMMPTHT